MRLLLPRFPRYPREVFLGSFQAKVFRYQKLALVVSSPSLWVLNHTEKDPLVWGSALVGGQIGHSSRDTGIYSYVPSCQPWAFQGNLTGCEFEEGPRSRLVNW